MTRCTKPKQYMPKRGDIYTTLDNVAQKPERNYYLILSTNKWYAYEVLHLNTGEIKRISKSELLNWAYRVRGNDETE